MPTYHTLDDLDVGGKRVLVRVDLNVPMRDGEVSDMTRIERALPTIEELSKRGARVILLSHFGRPKGRRVEEMSLLPVARALMARLGRTIGFAEDCVGSAAISAIENMSDGDIVLLENLRFHEGEERNDPLFARELANLGDLYVNDAFSTAHRAHASTEAITRLLPAAAGRGMEAELSALAAALETPQRPLAAIVGGAKISTKLDLLGNLVSRVDQLIVGGGMANTFLNALGIAVGKSLCEHDLAETARAIADKAKTAGCEVVLPVDAVVAREFKVGVDRETVAVTAVPGDAMILDIGPASVKDLEKRLKSCRTLVWNGPLGAFEIPPFDRGTVAVAKAAARLTRAGGLKSVAGGGDTVAALAHAGVTNDFSYVSTAGGAFLEWLEGKELPGVAALYR